MSQRDDSSEGMQQRQEDPEFHARASERMKKRWQDPEFRAYMSDTN